MEAIKHKISFILPTKDFKSTEKVDLIVTQTLPENSKNFEFSVKIPTFLYNELLGYKDEFRSYQDMLALKKKLKSTNYNEYVISKDVYLKKEFKSNLITTLVSEIEKLSSEAVLKNTKEDLMKEKKIFIKFKHSSRHQKMDWTGGWYMGKKTSSDFQFFIGYKIYEKLNIFDDAIVPNYYTYIKYSTGTTAKLDTGFKEGNSLEPLHWKRAGESERFEDMYDIIEWTQEAEDFLTLVQDRFEMLFDDLSEYLNNIDNDKMKMLIKNSKNFKLLN